MNWLVSPVEPWRLDGVVCWEPCTIDPSCACLSFCHTP